MGDILWSSSHSAEPNNVIQTGRSGEKFLQNTYTLLWCWVLTQNFSCLNNGVPVFHGQLLFSCFDDDWPLTPLDLSVSIPHIL